MLCVAERENTEKILYNKLCVDIYCIFFVLEEPPVQVNDLHFTISASKKCSLFIDFSI